jgi:hypothetical protein
VQEAIARWPGAVLIRTAGRLLGVDSWRGRRRRLQSEVAAAASGVLDAVARIEDRAADAMACVAFISKLPGMDAAALRDEHREVQYLFLRARSLGRAAAGVLAAATHGGLPPEGVLRELLLEIHAYTRRFALLEQTLGDRHDLLAHSRTMLARHEPMATAFHMNREAASNEQAL